MGGGHSGEHVGRSETKERVAACVGLLLSILFLPWWLTVIIVLLCFFRFRWFFEGVVAGLLMDLLYGVPVPDLQGIPFIFTGIFFVILIFGETIKPYLSVIAD